jgi:trimeric autotransporter adhesin
VAGRESTEVRVEFNGRTTTAVRVGVGAAMPGVFSMDQSGVGQGAILNQDYSGNSPANPALRGSAVMVYATGEGQTTPAGVSGRVNTGVVPLPRPEQTVRATIGGMQVPVEYACAAPDLVSGVLQVNLRIPQNAPTGSSVPVVITVGDTPSQRNLTMAIR